MVSIKEELAGYQDRLGQVNRDMLDLSIELDETSEICRTLPDGNQLVEKLLPSALAALSLMSNHKAVILLKIKEIQETIAEEG